MLTIRNNHALLYQQHYFISNTIYTTLAVIFYKKSYSLIGGKQCLFIPLRHHQRSKGEYGRTNCIVHIFIQQPGKALLVSLFHIILFHLLAVQTTRSLSRSSMQKYTIIKHPAYHVLPSSVKERLRTSL